MHLSPSSPQKFLAKRLLNYATGAGVFITLQPVLNAQVVHEDIDPDEMMYFTSEDSLDLNHDGVYDIKFTLYKNSSVSWSTYESDFLYRKLNFGLTGFDAVLVDTGLGTDYNLQELNQGDIVGPDAAWDGDGALNVSYIYTKGNGDIENVANWIGEDKTFGLRFQIDGQSHYGWVRLSLVKFINSAIGQRYFIIQDYAWELQPDTPIEVGATTVAPAQQLTLTDVGETGTAADMRLDFMGADDETGISEYRVYLFPYDFSYAPKKLSDLLLLDDTRYKTVTPGADTYTLYFSDEDLTAEGLPITQSEEYNAVVVSMANGVDAIHNIISIQSHNLYLGFRITDQVNFINLGLIPELNNIGDFNVSYYEGDTMGVVSHRIYLLKQGDYLSANLLMNLNENYYTEIPPISPSYFHEVKLNPAQLVVNGSEPEFFNYYYVAIASIANNITASNSSVNYNDDDPDEFIEYFVNVYQERPVVTIENPANNTSNIRVQFPHTEYENNLVYYKFMITPAADTSYYNVADANAATGTKKTIKFTPAGIDIDLNMYADMTDVHGNPIDSATEYVIFCLLYINDNSTKITLSLPSKPFKLNSTNSIPPNNQVIIENETLQINLISFDNYDFSIVNEAGRVVYKGITTGPTTVVDLSFLANGIYFVNLNAFHMDSTEIIVAGR